VAGASVVKKRKRAGTHIVAAGAAPAAVSVARPKEPIAVAAPTPAPRPRQVAAARKKPGDGVEKKQPVHRSGLPPVAPPPAVIDAPHDNYVGVGNVFVDTPTRYETLNFVKCGGRLGLRHVI
jgi:hypothetical protein